LARVRPGSYKCMSLTDLKIEMPCKILLRISLCLYRLFDKALENVQEALRTAPPVDREVRRVLVRLRDEIRAEMGASSTGQPHQRSLGGAVSVATLNEPETSL